MKYIVITFAMLAAGSAMATQSIDKSVEVFANIPTQTFYVQPEGGWMSVPQELNYNTFTGALDPVNKRLIAKSTTGAIQGKLDYPAVITSGRDSIGLTVTIAGTELSSTAAEVVAAADIGREMFLPIQIAAAAAPTGGYAPGNYAGFVNMTFETPLTPPPAP